MDAIADMIRLVILHVFGWLLPTTLLVWICIVLDSHGLNPLKSMKRFIASIPPVGRIVLGVLLVGFIVCGSTKSGGDTNSPQSRMSAPRRVENGQWRMESGVTAEDIARGWRVVTSAEAESIVDMPTGAVTNDQLRRRGGFDWAFRVEPEGWRFPYRDGVLTGVTVFAKGEVRPDVGTLYFPVPLTNGVSLLPEARWGLLDHAEPQSRREGSVFSHAVTTNGSLLLDWHNALVGRDVNSPTNMQMELFSDGSFAWRTDGGSTSYLPVLPFDYDGDGLENSVDLEPLSPNSIDAHGTNAEWYRIVCSNVFEVTGTTGILPVDGGSVQFKTNVNSLAYYFVDVVASSGPAPIYFNADRDSRLGSPVVVARAGETNHMPLLIGVEYTVTSTVPITVSASDAMYATVTSNDERSVTVKWPLEFQVTTSEDGHTVTVTPTPNDPGGIFEWRSEGGGSGGARLMSASTSACSYVVNGGCISWGCGTVYCGCHGCSISGDYTLEDALLNLPTIWCGCWPEHPEEPEPTPVGYPDMASNPSVTVMFSEPAVIFENAYTNAPNDVVGRRSTTNVLTIAAYGGPNGAFLNVNPGLLESKFQWTGGHHLPTSPVRIPENSDVRYEVLYVGKEASGRKDDIEVMVSLSAINAMSPSGKTAKTTSVRVEIEPEKKAFENPCKMRHRFGVCEIVKLRHFPGSVEASWRIPGNGQDLPYPSGVGQANITLPAKKVYFSTGLEIDAMGTKYTPLVTLVEPAGVLCTQWVWNEVTKGVGNERKNQAGWVGMYLTLVITPRDVSFENIDVEEVPSTVETHTPYFNYLEGTDYISHTKTAGAGVWHCIGSNNYFCVDEAFTKARPTPWIAESRHEWAIPHGWRKKTASGRPWDNFMSKVGNFGNYTQVFTIDANGNAGVEKHGKVVTRSTNNCVRVQGSVVYGED